eukprot:scaffold21638_cov44-Attheya_sp.AAC.1
MATSIDADSDNDVAAAKCVSGYVDTPAVTDAEDAGAAESVTRVWAPSSAEDIAVTAAEGVAASVDSAEVKIAEGAGSSKDFARDFGPTSGELPLLLWPHRIYPVSPVSVKQLSIHCFDRDCIP